MILEHWFVPVLVLLTASLTYVVGWKWLGLQAAGLPGAVRRAAEYVGAMLFFAILNLVAALVFVWIVRRLWDHAATPYVADDTVLIVLSAVEGLIFQLWREAAYGVARTSEPADRRGRPRP